MHLSRGEKRTDPIDQHLMAYGSCLAFPDDQDFPAKFAQLLAVPPVSVSVAFSLASPELRICPGDDSPEGAPMEMPEAAVNEDDLSQPGEHKVRRPWEASAVEPESVSQSVRKTTYGKFWLGVFASNGSHAALALFGGKDIGHPAVILPQTDHAWPSVAEGRPCAELGERV
jgi:hypothetical protein